MFKELFYIEDMIKMNENYIFLSSCLKGIYALDSERKSIKRLVEFDAEKTSYRLFSYLLDMGEIILCVPLLAENIVLVNKQSNEIEYIKVPTPKKMTSRFYNGGEKFFYAQKYEDKVVFIPAKYPGILILDLSTRTMSIIDDWVEELEKDGIDTNFCYFRKSNSIKDNLLYVASTLTAKILIINLKNLEITIRNIEIEGKDAFSGIYIYKCKMFLSCLLTPRMISIDLQSENKEIIQLSNCSCTYPNLCLLEGQLLNGNILLWQQRDNGLYVFSCIDNSFQIINRSESDKIDNHRRYTFTRILDEKILFFSNSNKIIWEYDDKFSPYNIKFNGELLHIIWNDNKNLCFYETHKNDLIEYIQLGV